MNFFVFATIVLMFVFFGTDVSAGTAPFRHEKSYTLPSGKTVATVFQERLCNSGECREADSGIWGIDGGTPRFVTEVFRVLINGRNFIIPQKFYRDLTNTHFLDVSEQDGNVVVELKGGDAAGAYTARFILGGMCGFERKICGEVCNEIWERTVWYNSFAYDFDPKCRNAIK